MSKDGRHLGRHGGAVVRYCHHLLFARRSLKGKLADGSKVAVGGAMLASLNTASEYGFGGVIAALPGFVQWPMR